MPTASPALRLVSRTTLAVGGLALLGCVVLAIASYVDTSSSTSSIGVAVAIVLALPVLLAMGLTGVGLRVQRRSSSVGTAMVILGAVVLAGILLLVALQLVFGS